MKNIYWKVIALLTLSLPSAAFAQIQYSNEFWISTNANGNIYPSALGTNGGTLANPLDGSTEANFYSNMQNLPAYSTIHIMPGIYQVNGNGTLKSGQKIRGSGIDVTIIQIASNVDYGAAVFSQWDSAGNNLTNCEISDLTADANGSPGEQRCGISMSGTENEIRRVKLVNTSSDGHECWGLILNTDLMTSQSEGNIIEDCEVSQYLGASGANTADEIGIAIIDGDGPSISGIIRGNRILCSPTNVVYAINADYNSVIEDNYVDGAVCGMYNDSDWATNVIVTHNIFNNVQVGVGLFNTVREDMTFSYNTILLSTNGSSQTAFDFASSFSTNFNVIGNTVGWYSRSTGSGLFMYVNDIQGLVVADNRIDAALNNNISESGDNYIIRDNYDLEGNYLSMNIPTVGNTPVSPLGFELVDSTASLALMDLGLPGNPSVIVTNGEMQSLTFDTNLVVNGTNYASQFVGGGAGITGLSASQLTSGTVPLARLPSAILTNNYTSPVSLLNELDLGGALYNGYFALSTLGNGASAEFLSPTNDVESLIRFGSENYNHLIYIGILEDPGYDSFQILNDGAKTNDPIAVFNSDENGGNGYVGIGTNVPSQKLTVSGNILATGTNYASQFIGGGTGMTGLNPSNITSGTAVINISGNAVTATTANTALTNATITVTGSQDGGGQNSIVLTNVYVSDTVDWRFIVNPGDTFGLISYVTFGFAGEQGSYTLDTAGGSCRTYFPRTFDFEDSALIDSSKTNFIVSWDLIITNIGPINLTNLCGIFLQTNTPNGGSGIWSPSAFGGLSNHTNIFTGIYGTNRETINIPFSVPYSILTNLAGEIDTTIYTPLTSVFLIDARLHN